MPVLAEETEPPLAANGKRLTEFAEAGDPLLRSDGVGAIRFAHPHVSAVFEGGKDGKRLTGRGAIHLGRALAGHWNGDLSLTGADTDDSGNSRVLEVFDGAPGGTASLGLTYDTFGFDQQDKNFIEKLKKVCASHTPEQRLKDALGKDPLYPAANAQATAAEQAATELEEGALSAEQQADRAEQKKDEKASLRRDEARRKRAVAEIARATARTATRLRDNHQARVNAALDEPACVYSKLSVEEQAQVGRPPFQPSVVASVRASLTARSTKFYDPVLDKNDKEVVFPWKLAAAFGMFVTPMSLVSLSGTWGMPRDVKDAVQLCTDLKIKGVTAVPPASTCTSTIVGRPTWSHKVTARLELRQYLASTLSWNPSVAVATDSSSIDLSNSWKFDLPLYFKLSVDKDTPLTVGIAFSASSANSVWRPDVGVFLASAFALVEKR